MSKWLGPRIIRGLSQLDIQLFCNGYWIFFHNKKKIMSKPLSLHLHSASSAWHALITDAIYDFVQSLLEKKKIDKCFYIRYNEKGPHIRLRMYGEAEVLEKEVKEAAIAYFEAYFKENPSEFDETERAMAIQQGWLPNNQVVVAEYDPELERFGGKAMMPVVEMAFFSSTMIVLELLKNHEALEYMEVISLSIKLQLTMVHSAGMDLEKARAFFKVYYENWLPVAVEAIAGAENAEQAKPLIVNYFKESYEVNQPAFDQYVQEVWAALESGEFMENEILFAPWAQSNQLVFSTALHLHENKLWDGILPPYLYQADGETSGFEAQYFSILGDLIHLTNNRLGIFNRDEPFIAYVLMKSLK